MVSVTRVLQGCNKGVTRMFQGCYKCVMRVFQGSMVKHGCYIVFCKGIVTVLQEGVARVLVEI